MIFVWHGPTEPVSKFLMESIMITKSMLSASSLSSSFTEAKQELADELRNTLSSESDKQIEAKFRHLMLSNSFEESELADALGTMLYRPFEAMVKRFMRVARCDWYISGKATPQ